MGRQKLLLPFGDSTIIQHIVHQVVGSDVDETLVVLGHDREAVCEKLTGFPIRQVVNPDPAGEMLGSVRCGLRELHPDSEAIVLALGDQPGLTPELLNALIRQFHSTGKKIVVPARRGKRGHPLLFSTDFRDEVLSEFEDTGLRGLLQKHANEIYEFEVQDRWILEDVDTPEDYQRVRQRTGDEKNSRK